MVPYVEYRSQRVSTLHLEINPDSEFRIAVDEFGQLRYPPLGVNPDLIGFVLLELVANSLRAHRERGVNEAVRVSFTAEEDGLSVVVVDSGRGFDPSLLPYRLEEPVANIDLMGEAFAEYRERNGGSRFGMGIYSVKKIFPRFALKFVDREGNPCPWYSGMVRGTRIELGIPYVEGEPVAAMDEAATLEEL